MLLANRFLTPEKIRLFYEKIFVLVAPRNFHRIRRVFLRCRNHHLIESSGFAARTTKRAVIARNQCSGALQSGAPRNPHVFALLPEFLEQEKLCGKCLHRTIQITERQNRRN